MDDKHGSTFAGHLIWTSVDLVKDISYDGRCALHVRTREATMSKGSFGLLSRQLKLRNAARFGATRDFACSTRCNAPQQPRQDEQKSTISKTVDFGFETVAESLKQARGQHQPSRSAK